MSIAEQLEGKVVRRTIRQFVDDDGYDRTEKTTVTRELCAMLANRNGAWLIIVCGLLTTDSTPGELYDCAGSLAMAKRVARRQAIEFGYEPAFHWEQESWGSWYLTAKHTDVRTYYDQDIT